MCYKKFQNGGYMLNIDKLKNLNKINDFFMRDEKAENIILDVSKPQLTDKPQKVL